MRIKSFTVINYRSIKSANSIPIGNKCVIIGPNNEGKSNILQGLVLCLSTLTDGFRRRIRRFSSYRLRKNIRNISYEWERDYPVDLQSSMPNGESQFQITIELNNKEKKELTTLIDNEILGEMKFILKFGRNSLSIEFEDGKRKKKLTENILDKIFTFFNQHLSFYYIPAIRPTEYSIEIVEGLLEEGLSVLNTNNNYNLALKKLESLQKPILSALSNQLTTSIKEFIPEVKKVEVVTEDTLRRVISRSLSISIDDNAKTDIEQKGDGIKSLIAISLVNHSIQMKSPDKSMVLALEEPESHLHPAAIHRLNKIINEISSKQQVIITTHSPLLTDRSEIVRNILVNKQKAQQADSIISIRDAIGVHASDNLTNSSWVLLVEGKSDEIIIKKWLSKDKKVKRLLNDSQLIIDSLSGGSNLSYKISLFNSMLCNVLVFLDDDDCGKRSFEEAMNKSLIDIKYGVFSIVPGRKESEIEDMINPEVYAKEVLKRYGVDLNLPKHRKSIKKWSNRVKDAFRSEGKQWNDKIEKEVKLFVANCVNSFNGETLKNKSEGPIENIITIIKHEIDLSPNRTT